MEKYKDKLTGNIATVIDNWAIGVCDKTAGMAFIIYSFENDKTTHHYMVMEIKEFHKIFEPIFDKN